MDDLDAQFDRAVRLVQAMPPEGPLQTGYNDRLSIYSLFKQATLGNVNKLRPGMWDMLGRAKWDKWSQLKDMDPREAKHRYIETVQKVLRKHPDQSVAEPYLRELGYSPTSSMVVSGYSQRSNASSDSNNSSREIIPSRPPPPSLPPASQHLPRESEDEDDLSTTDSEMDEISPTGTRQYLYAGTPPTDIPVGQRPTSSQSNLSRYRTPQAGGLHAFQPLSPSILPPGPIAPLTRQNLQATPDAPLPSTFSAPPTARLDAPAPYTQPSYPPHLAPSASASGAQYRASRPPSSLAPRRPGQPISLERAIEHMQAALAALHERIDILETRQGSALPRSRASFMGSRSTNVVHDSGDFSHLGLWSTVFTPIYAILNPQEGRSGPMRIVLRRLFLDASFLFTCLIIFRVLWRVSGVRRREIIYAFRQLIRAIVLGRRAAERALTSPV